ncbi:alpha/beta fold hydrolase [Reinekea sp.]|uniref:alpha/beta fold hydrolase n=1 Tax=Reinekea sp. TaxID=1970455 RepID=UPI002A7ECC44|nr:alpha/beta fold hydrolase [Reinekea sp.]
MSRVWLPGWHCHSHMFDALRAELSGGQDDILLSYAETNLSRAEWLAEQVEALAEGVTLVGWSLGGMLACELASLSTKVKAVYVLNANLQFAGAAGLEPSIAEAFLARYQTNPTATLRRFAQLVDPVQNAVLEPFLLAGNQLASLRWLYDIDLRDQAIACPVHLLLAQDDRLVPCAKASQAWADQATSLTTMAGEHSLPLSAPHRVAAWLKQHG